MSRMLATAGLILVMGATAISGNKSANPLTREDVMLLAYSSAPEDHKIQVVEKSSIGFDLDADFERELRKAGVGRAFLAALAKATGHSGSSFAERALASARPLEPKTAKLPRPAQELIPVIIMRAAENERRAVEALKNYTYREADELYEFDPTGRNVIGAYRRERDIVFRDNGKPIAKKKFGPKSTLRRIWAANDEVRRPNLFPFFLLPEKLPDYEITYVDHLDSDDFGVYRFRVSPKVIRTKEFYFQGTIWVEDVDLQIVRTEGRIVPDIRAFFCEILWIRGTTYREKVDGQYWFPVEASGVDTLQFSRGAVQVKSVTKYTDYRLFKSESRILEYTDSP
jgi:hypothetical protein